MASIGNYAAHIKRQKRTHQPAYGRSRQRTPEQKARYVAESIMEHQADGRAWSWASYGLDDNRSSKRA